MALTDSIQYRKQCSEPYHVKYQRIWRNLDEHIALSAMFQGSPGNVLVTFSYFLYLFCEPFIAQLQFELLINTLGRPFLLFTSWAQKHTS